MLNWRFAREVGFHRYVARNIVRQFHKRVLRADLRATMPTGMDYLVPTWSPGASEVYVRGGHIDQGLERVLFALLPQDAVLVDIGAHVGVYGAYCAPKLKHYIAVEPSAQCWPYIGKTLPESVQVTLVRGFCGAVPGKARGEHDRRNGGVYPAAGPGTIPVVTVDNLCPCGVDAIKIDVDGTDFEVLLGARGAVERYRPAVLIEHAGIAKEKLATFASTYRMAMIGVDPLKQVVFELESTEGYLGKMVLMVPIEKSKCW